MPVKTDRRAVSSGSLAARCLLVTLLLGLTASPVWADWTATGRFNYTDRLYDLTGFTGTTIRPVREADVDVQPVAAHDATARRHEIRDRHVGQHRVDVQRAHPL